MSLFGNTANAQNNLLSNSSTQALSNSSTQNDKDKQGPSTSLFGNTTNPQGTTTSLFTAPNPQPNASLFGGSGNNSNNANQTNTNLSFLNTSNQSNIDKKDKTEQSDKPFGTGSLFGANPTGPSLFGKSDNSSLKPASGSLFSKPAEESTKAPIAPNSGVTSSLFGNANKQENAATSATASTNFLAAGFKAPQSQANEEKKDATTSGSTSLFGQTTSKPSNSLFGTTSFTSGSGNLFGSNTNATNASKEPAENKPASTGLFGTGSGFSIAANPQSGLFGQTKPAGENPQESKEIKSNLIEEKKNESTKQPLNLSGSSLFGNVSKPSEPEKQAAPITANVSSLFGNAPNAATSTASDAKTNLFGAPNKAQPSAEVKTNLFGASGLNLGSSGMFGANKPSESTSASIPIKSSSDGANLLAPQAGSNQTFFGSFAKKPEEKSEVQKDSQQAKPLFGSVQTSNVSTNPFASSTANLQSTPKKTEETKSTISAQETKPNLFKPTEPSATSSQPNISNLFGSKDAKTDNKISFGGPTFSTAPAQSVSETSKTIPNFGAEKKVATVANLNKIDKPADSSKINIPGSVGFGSEADKKLPAEISKLSKPSEPVKEIKIEDLKYDNLMNRTIDETINNWKLELETQTEIFNNNAEKIKQFEFSFLKNFDNIQILNNVIDKIESDTKESIENMKSISHQEDNVIDELDLIEKGLDKYLEIVSKRVPQEYVDNNYLYQTTLDLDKEIKMIQNEINCVQKTIVNDNEKINITNPNLDKTTVISYENIGANEIVDIDKNDIESILNGYYNSLKVIQTLQNSIENKIVDIDSDIADINNRRNYGWS